MDHGGNRIYQRLVVDLHAVIGQRPANLPFDVVLPIQFTTQGRLEGRVTVPSSRLDVVHGGIGLAQDAVDVGAGAGYADADADRDQVLLATDGHRLADDPDDAAGDRLGQRPGMITRGDIEDHDELVPPVPGYEVARLGGLP